jgi:hypothetical protein
LPSQRRRAVAQRETGEGEFRASKALEAIRGDPLALHVFLKRMPKGADLHSHLHSAVYAETLIRNAIEDKLCVDRTRILSPSRKPWAMRGPYAAKLWCRRRPPMRISACMTA